MLFSFLRHAATQIADHEFWLLWVYGVPLLLASYLPLPVLGACFATLPLFWIARRVALGTWSVSTPLDLPISLLLVMGLVGSVVSVNPATSARIYAELIGCVALYYGVVNGLSARTDETVQNLAQGHLPWNFSAEVWLLVGLAGAMAVIGVLGLNDTSKIPLISRLYVFLPTLESLFSISRRFSSNNVAGAIAPVIPLCLAWAWTQTAKRRALMLALSLCLLLAVILTQSRGAGLGLVAGLLVLAVWRFPKLILLVPIAIILIASLTMTGAVDPNVIFVSDATPSASSRLELWSRALYMLQDFPFTGVGLGNFEKVLDTLYPVFFASSDTSLPHAHNVYLQMGVEYGLPGLVAFMGVVTATVAAGVYMTFTARGTSRSYVAIGLLGGLVTYLVHGLTDYAAFSTKTAVIFWLMVGLIMALRLLTLRLPSGIRQ